MTSKTCYVTPAVYTPTTSLPLFYPLNWMELMNLNLVFLA